MDSNRIASQVEEFFIGLGADVFAGDPAANPALDVEVIAERSIGEGVGVVLVAPWTITGMFFSEADAFPEKLDVAGHPLRILENELPSLGRYRAVTLVRDIDAITSQEDAHASVAPFVEPFFAALTRIVEDGVPEDPSRRELFRSLRGDR